MPGLRFQLVAVKPVLSHAQLRPGDVSPASSMTSLEVPKAKAPILTKMGSGLSSLRLSLESSLHTMRQTVRKSMRRTVESQGSSKASSYRASALSVRTEDLESYALSQTSFSAEMRRCSVSSHNVLKRGGSVLSNAHDETKHENYASEAWHHGEDVVRYSLGGAIGF